MLAEEEEEIIRLGLLNGGRWGVCYFLEKAVVDLFGGADFHGAHHFAGGDDDTAEGAA